MTIKKWTKKFTEFGDIHLLACESRHISSCRRKLCASAGYTFILYEIESLDKMNNKVTYQKILHAQKVKGQLVLLMQ